MYKQYLNDYEKRAEQIRRAAKAVETGKGEMHPVVAENKKTELKGGFSNNEKTIERKKLFERFSTDDILLLGLLFLLISSEEKDITLIIILGYLFLTGL